MDPDFDIGFTFLRVNCRVVFEPVRILREVADNLVEPLLKQGDADPVEPVRGRGDQVGTGIHLHTKTYFLFSIHCFISISRAQ